MKIKHLLLGAAAIMAASCSEDVIEKGSTHEPLDNADGYIAVRVNLPQETGSRAANDAFNDGLADEYNVEDGVILLFVGENEAGATLAGAYPLDGTTADMDVDNDNITASYLKSIKVKSLTVGATQKLYGLVMLNYTNVGEVTGGHEGFKLKGANVAVSTLSSLTENVNADYATLIGTDKDYFFMANSPLVNKAGGPNNPTGATVQTLVEMEPALYKTQALAEAAPAASFYVERAVAKVTVSQTVEAIELAVAPTSTIDEFDSENFLAIEEFGWVVGNKQQTSYIVRNVKGAGSTVYPWLAYSSSVLTPANYRFVGHTPMGTTTIQPVQYLYRPYWCYDPVYAADKTVDDVTNAAYTTEYGFDKPQYCHENTFDVDHQNHKNTTSVMLKVTINGGNDFYTINDRQNVIYNQASAETYAKNYIIKRSEVYEALKAALNTPTDEGVTNVLANAEDVVNIQFARTANGYWAVSSISFNNVTIEEGNTGFKAQPQFNEGEAESIKADVNKQYQIAQYVGGVNYYSVQIKHFAGSGSGSNISTDLAPWQLPETITNTDDVEDSYYWNTEWDNDQVAKNYLGRYGMVRNNWYDLSFTKIGRLGAPAMTDLTVSEDGRPDDEKNEDKYIAFKINVLSWAKRTQYVEL